MGLFSEIIYFSKMGSFSESILFLKMGSFWGVIRWELNVKNKKGVIQWQEIWKWGSMWPHIPVTYFQGVPPPRQNPGQGVLDPRPIMPRYLLSLSYQTKKKKSWFYGPWVLDPGLTRLYSAQTEPDHYNLPEVNKFQTTLYNKHMNTPCNEVITSYNMLIRDRNHSTCSVWEWNTCFSLTPTCPWVWWGRCKGGRKGGWRKKCAQRAHRAWGSNPGPAAC